MISNIRTLLLDVLKPHDPSVIELAQRLVALECIEGVEINVIEVDARTETVTVSLVGRAVDFDAVRAEIEEAGATIHSVDQVSAGAPLTPAALPESGDEG